MKLQERKLQVITPGVSLGVQVVDGELHYALKEFKRLIKESNKIQEVYEKRYYTKPSVSKRKMLDNAKFLQKNKSNKEKLK